MKLLFLSLFIFSYGIAQDCNYTIDAKDIKVSWTAFKTPRKEGVGGQFTELGLAKETFTATSFANAIQDTKFSINSASVFTNDSGRDKTIVDNFFKGIGQIQGSIKKVRQNTITLELTMNKVKREVPLQLSREDGKFHAKGTIDIFDFSMNKHFKMLNKACLALHEGKTWSDVNVALSGSFTKTCK